MEKYKIVDGEKLGLLHGRIHLLKVNYNWDFIREKKEGEVTLNTNQDYMNFILEIDNIVKDIYNSTKNQ